MSILRHVRLAAATLLGLGVASGAALADPAEFVVPLGPRPVKPGRCVLAPDLARRAARRLRAKRRGATKLARGAHLVQLGPYGHTDRRPTTPDRVNSRQARCGDCHGTGVRVQLQEVRVGRQAPPVTRLLRQSTACGCVRS